MSEPVELAEIFFGVDASPQAVSRAVTHVLTLMGLSPSASEFEYSYFLDFTISQPKTKRYYFRLEVKVNDAYFDPEDGGQQLLSAYPIMAKLSGWTSEPDAAHNGAPTHAQAVNMLSTLMMAFTRELRWPVIATSVDGELLVAYKADTGEQHFRPGVVTANSPREVWERWLDLGLWPTAHEYEDETG